MTDKHDEIAERVAKVFIDRAYVHTLYQGHEWSMALEWGADHGAGTATVEVTHASLQAALALALAAFAREYGLTPSFQSIPSGPLD